MDEAQIERERAREINIILEGDHEESVSMDLHVQATECCFLVDQWDTDGHSVLARAASRFRLDGLPNVIAEFARGSSPEMVARALRKFADMLDGPKGYQIVNLGSTDADFTYAQRLPDGDVQFYNLRLEYGENLEHLEHDAESDDQADDDSPAGRD